MKFSKVEWAGLALTALALVFLAGWHLRDAFGHSYRIAGGHPPRADRAAVQSFTPDGLVDLNTATLADLMSLPGLGQVRSQAILDYRSDNGPFTYPEDVMKVPGVGRIIYEDISDYITALSP